MDPRVTIVIATYNRAMTLLRTLDRMGRAAEHAPIIVVDNGSRDDTAMRVAGAFPHVRLLQLRRNYGAAARTVGAQAAQTPYIACCDDDCWWEAGSLDRAAALLDAYTAIAVLNARVLVGDEQRLDPACTRMEETDLPACAGGAGKRIVGFMAGASVVRRQAFLAAGGYHRRYLIGGEESLLAVDLMNDGWELAYVPELVVHHHPSPEQRDNAQRRRLTMRNRLWTAWLRRSTRGAVRATLGLAVQAAHDPLACRALAEAVAGWLWISRERRPVRREVERLLEHIPS